QSKRRIENGHGRRGLQLIKIRSLEKYGLQVGQSSGALENFVWGIWSVRLAKRIAVTQPSITLPCGRVNQPVIQARCAKRQEELNGYPESQQVAAGQLCKSVLNLLHCLFHCCHLFSFCQQSFLKRFKSAGSTMAVG